MTTTLPGAITEYVEASNAFDGDRLIAVFADDALGGGELRVQVVGQQAGQHLTGVDVVAFLYVDFGNWLGEVGRDPHLPIGNDHAGDLE